MKCEICGKEILRDSQCINYKYYHNDCIENLQQENKQLRDNWNKLKEYAKENMYYYSGYQNEDLEIDYAIQGVLNKMKELEGSDSDE